MVIVTWNKWAGNGKDLDKFTKCIIGENDPGHSSLFLISFWFSVFLGSWCMCWGHTCTVGDADHGVDRTAGTLHHPPDSVCSCLTRKYKSGTGFILFFSFLFSHLFLVSFFYHFRLHFFLINFFLFLFC